MTRVAFKLKKRETRKEGGRKTGGEGGGGCYGLIAIGKDLVPGLTCQKKKRLGIGRESKAQVGSGGEEKKWSL